MKYMLIRKADSQTEQGTLPDERVFKAMAEYNERMLQAGVFISGDGLRPTSEGCRIQFRNGEPQVTRGPFAPPEQQLAGYTVLEVDSLEEAIDWATQWPREDTNGNLALELRRYFAMEDFAPGEGKTQHQRHRDLPQEMNVHVSFPGTCREAMAFYAEVTGGQVEALLTFGETPAASEVPAEWRDRIIHASLNLRGRRLMGADMTAECHQQIQGAEIHLEYRDPTRAEQVFQQLAEGGQIIMPFEQTFWAHRFGMATDRFGVRWMISCQTGNCPQAAGSNAP